MFKGLVVPIVFGTLIMIFVEFHSFIQLACWIVLYSVVYCINAWVFSMNKYEKELITTPLKKLVLRVSNIVGARGGGKIYDTNSG